MVEYAKRGNKLVGVVSVTTGNWQVFPSIVYGLFGMLFFVTYCHWKYSILAGAFTLSIMILPLLCVRRRKPLCQCRIHSVKAVMDWEPVN